MHRAFLLRTRFVFALILLLPGASTLLARPSEDTQAAAANPSQGVAGQALIDEARRFMADYAADLRHGNREKLAARYDRNGIYQVGPGEKRFVAYADLAERYRMRWNKPATFEWRDLSYEALAADTVLVTGLFAWGASPSPSPDIFSYVAILRRQEGDLRIRLEAEASGPAVP